MVDRRRVLGICCWVAAFIFSFVYAFYIVPLIVRISGLLGFVLLFLSLSLFGFLVHSALIYTTEMPEEEDCYEIPAFMLAMVHPLLQIPEEEDNNEPCYEIPSWFWGEGDG